MKSPPSKRNSTRNQTLAFIDNIDEELALVWKGVEGFCSAMDLIPNSKRRVPESTITKAMASFMYRLLHAHFASESFDEVLRIGLLAVCSRVFLNLPSLNGQDTSLRGAYRQSLVNIVPLASVPAHIVLWLQMIGAICVFDAGDDVWLQRLLRSSMERCNVASWGDLAGVMNSVIWIGLLFDEPGRHLFNLIMDE